MEKKKKTRYDEEQSFHVAWLLPDRIYAQGTAEAQNGCKKPSIA
jgi:hypothetical protein